MDPSRVTEEGTSVPCQECDKRFWVHKESFARRILKKDGKIYCVKCSQELGPSVVCSGCGAMFPDYHAVLTAKPARRQIEKTGFSVSFSPAQAKQSYSFNQTKTTHASKSTLIKIGLAVLAVLLVVGAGIFYQDLKAQQQFAKNYVLALYGIKTGSDLSLATCSRISTDWKTKTEAGQNSAPRIAANDEVRLNAVRDELDKVMQKLNKPPKKFGKASEKLANLYGTYDRLHSLAVAPSGSLPGFTDAASKAEADYRKAVQELKTNLPAELSEELEKGKTKFKDLQNL